MQLPSDPIDRAATCGVIAAAAARSGTDVSAPLSLEAQGRVLHHALLAASEGGESDGATANRVSRRMRELQARIVDGKWQALRPSCEAAYPLTAKREVTLPAGKLDAQLVCEELAEFFTTALEAEAAHYGNEFAGYRLMRRELNDALAAGLRARAGASREAQQRERRRALAAAAQLGSPVAVLGRCLERFE